MQTNDQIRYEDYFGEWNLRMENIKGIEFPHFSFEFVILIDAGSILCDLNLTPSE